MRTVVSLASLLFFGSIVPSAFSQTCTVSSAGLNSWRRVMGPVTAECPGSIHSAPFGNWGVTSNFGPKVNGNQFQGWHFSNNERQWNSCTPQFTGCSYMNWDNCTQQVTVNYGSSIMPTNVLGTVGAQWGVECPRDWNSDGRCDTGGCTNFTSYTTNNNYMSLYELDPGWWDELVQSLYFPSTTVNTTCDAFGCSPAEGSFVGVSFYQSGPPNQAVDTQFKLRYNGAWYNDGQYCRDLALYDQTYNCW